MTTRIQNLLGTALFFLLFITPAWGIEYKEYKYSRLQVEYFTVSMDKDEVIISAEIDGTLRLKGYDRDKLTLQRDQVLADGNVVFDTDGLFMEGRHFPFDRITDSRIMEFNGGFTITFLTRESEANRTSKFRRGNLISFGDKVEIDEDDFIRGMILSITGNVDVYGEVTDDVISLFGSVYVAPDAVVRGDVATVTGRIDAGSDASIYGEMFSTDKKGQRRRHRFYRRTKDISIDGRIKYDRVDGLGLYNEIEYQDADSVIPHLWAKVGYALNSERSRFELGLEQTLWRDPSLTVGGAFYRRLASEDDWLLDDDENTAFALLATEDFKDYYEADGGTVWLKFRPMKNLTFETRYRNEETKWLDARRHLWSMFGGNKLFDENFATVDSSFRADGIIETDTTTNGCLYGKVAWDTRNLRHPFERSAWHLSADLEWSHSDLNSDFDYRRYTVAMRRYQRINRSVMLILRGMYAGSDGYLPMYKRFYLGGLGTLQGYSHKEFMGSRFWMTNAEYRVDIPKSDLAISVLWNAAQIANDSKLDSSVDIKHDIGVTLQIEDDFRISLSRRLDRSFDNDPKIYVRLDHIF